MHVCVCVCMYALHPTHTHLSYIHPTQRASPLPEAGLQEQGGSGVVVCAHSTLQTQKPQVRDFASVVISFVANSTVVISSVVISIVANSSVVISSVANPT